MMRLRDMGSPLAWVLDFIGAIVGLATLWFAGVILSAFFG